MAVFIEVIRGVAMVRGAMDPDSRQSDRGSGIFLHFKGFFQKEFRVIFGEGEGPVSLGPQLLFK